jgi:hypothetical protein
VNKWRKELESAVKLSNLQHTRKKKILKLGNLIHFTEFSQKLIEIRNFPSVNFPRHHQKARSKLKSSFVADNKLFTL